MPEPYPDDGRRKRQLECLRLACDLAQLAKDDHDPDMRANFQRMADLWTDQAREEPSFPRRDLLFSQLTEGADQIRPKARPVVLIVEDEPLLRMLAVEVVEDAGLVALEACDADEAVALLESRPDIAVLFTDINMPGSMDGLKLAHAVRNRWPPIKLLLVSGQIRPQESELPSNSRFVPKPYGAAAMVTELRSLVLSSGL